MPESKEVENALAALIKPNTRPREGMLTSKALAFYAHRRQKYAGESSYYIHLEIVAQLAKHFGFDKTIQEAAYLHDILEDTNVVEQDLKDAGISDEIISIVKAVTDEPGKNRKEKKKATYPKIKANKDALKLKLCDRLANVMVSIICEPSKFKMYRDEHQEFLDNLYDSEDNKDFAIAKLWKVLDALLVGA